MNYYERHIGDYTKDTAHLSMLEHGAYTLLLDRYYSTESGIPSDQVHRVTRARTRQEMLAVDSVLAEFFTLTDGAWVKGRVEEEIEKASVKIGAARKNGRLGGRPPKNPAGSKTETQPEPTGFNLGSKNKTQPKALQTPDTRHHKDPPAKRVPPKPEGVAEQTWGDWLTLRRAKKAPVTETVMRKAFSEAAKAGLSFEAFLQVWCARGSQGLEAAWIDDRERKTYRERDGDAATAKANAWMGRSAPAPAQDTIDMEAPDGPRVAMG